MTFYWHPWKFIHIGEIKFACYNKFFLWICLVWIFSIHFFLIYIYNFFRTSSDNKTLISPRTFRPRIKSDSAMVKFIDLTKEKEKRRPTHIPVKSVQPKNDGNYFILWIYCIFIFKQLCEIYVSATKLHYYCFMLLMLLFSTHWQAFNGT